VESEGFLMAICEDRYKSLNGSSEKAEKAEKYKSSPDTTKYPGDPAPQLQNNRSQYDGESLFT
jgi:hypothetical protein